MRRNISLHIIRSEAENYDSHMDGLLLINKPAGITSFDCIRQLRRSLGLKKIGLTGTLDPMATGLMIMLVGSATKQAQHFFKLDKTYVAEITLGQVSTTGDGEGVITKTPSGSRRTKPQI